jgi:hypothetical protein
MVGTLKCCGSSPKRRGMAEANSCGIGGGCDVATREEAADVASIGMLGDLGASWGRGSGHSGKYGRGGVRKQM